MNITLDRNTVVENLYRDSSLWKRTVYYAKEQSLAEDLFQNVLLIVYQNLSQLKNPERLRPWVYTILKHEFLKQKLPSFLPLEENSFPFPQKTDHLEIKELREILRSTLSQSGFYTKTEKALADYVLREAFRGLNSKEIFRKMEKKFSHSSDYLYTILYRIRKKWQKHLVLHGYHNFIKN